MEIIRRTALVFHAVIGGRTDLHDVLRQARHHERIAAQVGQVNQLLVIENLALRGVGRFHQRHRFGDEHALGDVSYFEMRVHLDEFLRADNDVATLKLLETWRFGHNFIGGWHYVRKIVLSSRARHRSAGFVGALVRECDFGASYGGPGGVCNRTSNSALGGLRPSGCGC
jgi:hypothetical protein